MGFVGGFEVKHLREVKDCKAWCIVSNETTSLDKWIGN